MDLFYILIYYLRHTILEAKFPKENKNYSVKRPRHDCGISGRSVKAEARCRTHTITCRICGGEIGTAAGFCKNTSVSCERFLPEYFGVSFAITI